MSVTSLLKSQTAGLAIAAALCLGLALPQPARADDDPVVATVNGEAIHRSALEQIRAAVPYLKDVPLEHVYDALLDNVVDLTLVAAEAKKQGLAKDPVVERNMKAAERQILRSVYLTREIDKKLTDAQIKTVYDEWVKANPPEEEVHARHILLATEKEAKAVIDQLGKGADFAAVAKEKSTGPSAGSGGDLGYFKATDMVKPFADAAFAMKPGEVSKEPVKTQFGWHVIKVEDRRTAPVPTLEEIKPQLREQAAGEIAMEIVKGLREHAEVKKFDLEGKPVKP
ncbi:putative peptidyl-prolyl isomerase (PpiC-like) [uncultured Alphaproteobacteria bacterium]|uniref:Parvulin-like PPIase n=1 Tax=uncultured Alphaproteobacteria bacterium TaxID=91750 RepID=A0A212K1J5_9PROT|nr:putative peptidyl-prolyl isomerase (PpiC-like) [uncultured Alphaproteobacteria bacterium]